MQSPQTSLQLSSLAKPETIVVATDLTDLDFLLPHALAQAKSAGARIALVHAVPESYLVPVDPAAIPFVDRAQILEDSKALMLGTSKQLQDAGIACEVVCEPSLPLRLIEREVESRGATRVVMGTQGRGKLGQLALGSVAHDLVAHLKVPVLVVGPRAHNPSHGAPRRILHPVSLTGNYRESVDLAVELARAWHAELTLLYVFNDDIHEHGDAGRRIEWARTALSDLVPEDICLTAPIDTAAAFGKIPEQILNAANEGKADWIVMGVNSHNPLWSLKEDAAYQVIAGAPCPVLTLRHGLVSPAETMLPVVDVTGRASQLLANAGIF